MNSEPRHLADKGDKSLLLGVCPKLGAWDGWPRAKPYFSLVVFLDSKGLTDRAALAAFAKNALDAGARYIMSAGSAADDLDDAFDRAIIGGGYETDDDADTICTTTHKDDQMDEILWESIYVAQSEFKGCALPVLTVFFGEDPRAREYERLVACLDETLKRVEDRPA